MPFEDVELAFSDYSELSAKLDHLKNHVCTLSQTYGYYEQLNKVTTKAIAVNAIRGAAGLREVYLRSMLISGTALFADANRADDVTFALFNTALANEGFIEFCVEAAKRFGDDDFWKARYPEDVRAAVRLFLEDYAECRTSYLALTLMRNKAIAHITSADYARGTVGAVLKLADSSAQLFRHLNLVFVGADYDVASLREAGHLQVASLTRIPGIEEARPVPAVKVVSGE